MAQHEKSLTQKQKIIIYVSAVVVAMLAAIIAVIILVKTVKSPPAAIFNSSTQSNTSFLSSTNTSSSAQSQNTNNNTNSSSPITGIKNGTIYYTTQCVTIVGDNLASITVNGQEQSKQFFIDGNTTNMHVIEVTDTDGNTTTYIVYTKPISSLLEPIQDLNSYTVTIDDRKAITNVKNTALSLETSYSTTSENAEIEEIVQYCDNFLTRLDSVAKKIEDITKTYNEYFENSSQTEKKFDANQIIGEIDILLATKNLNNEQRNTLNNMRAKCQSLLPNISPDHSDVQIVE